MCTVDCLRRLIAKTIDSISQQRPATEIQPSCYRANNCRKRIQNYPVVSILFAKMNEEERELICCFHDASSFVKEYNFSEKVFMDVAKSCFLANRTDNEMVNYINSTRHLIHANICLPLESNYCDMPTTSGNIGYVVFWCILMAAIFSTNFFFCLAVFYSRSLLRKASNRFILSLAVSDLLMALFILPMKIDFTLHNQTFCSDVLFCHLGYFADHLICLSSLLILFAIGVDRYLAVTKPYEYENLMSKARSNVVILAIWILSCVVGILANIDWSNMTLNGVGIVDYTCYTLSPKYTGAVIVVLFFFPLITMGFIYYKIFRVTLQHAGPIAVIGDFRSYADSNDNVGRRNNNHGRGQGRGLGRNSEEGISFTENNLFKARKCTGCLTGNATLRALRAVVLIYGAFVICWLPGNIINVMNLFWPGSMHPARWVVHVFNEILPLSNSALNIFIYALMNEDCKRAMQKLLCCKFVQRHIHKKRFRRESLRRESIKSTKLSFMSSDLKCNA